MKVENKFFNVKDISEMLGISETTAYRLIKKLNEDLKKKGMITISGRISKRYFQERTYM
ncbi:MAG: helix-turn-helix domain-containing protein [Cetobacterium sp.]|uniref:helix-turn-helix domain-containing protein n=1 Tax=Cetobacterium sp. TaxID=2071632 RepID=UPI002FC6D099